MKNRAVVYLLISPFSFIKQIAVAVISQHSCFIRTVDIHGETPCTVHLGGFISDKVASPIMISLCAAFSIRLPLFVEMDSGYGLPAVSPKDDIKNLILVSYHVSQVL